MIDQYRIKYPKGEEAAYKEYLSVMQRRLEDAEQEKQQKRKEFNGLSVYGYYNQNEKIANTLNNGEKVIDPVKGKVNVKTGVPESKLDTVVANLLSLNLGSDVEAFDENNIKEIELGMAIENIIESVEERTEDQELQYFRFYELLKHGTAYVDVKWDRRFKKRKIMNNPEYNGEFEKYAGHIEKMETDYEGPVKKLLYGPHGS